MTGSHWLYVGRRLLVLVPQLLAVSFVTFALIHLLPGSPAALILGVSRTKERIRQLNQELGLDRPVLVQYWIYLKQVLHGDLGRSYFSGEPVASGLIRRVPATLELLTYSMIVALTVGVSIGAISAMRGNRGLFVRGTRVYGRLSGAFPDFWVALIALYFIFYRLRWAPAPIGRLSIVAEPPGRITGFYTVDSALRGDFGTLRDAFAHLALPVLVLGLVVAPLLAKITNSAMSEVLNSEYIRVARAMGLRRATIYRYAVRNASPPVLTMTGILVVYMLGGDVLIEKIFAWPGVGLYAVQAIANSDYLALQGFVLVAAVFTLVVYLVVDLIHMAIDPRVGLHQ